MITIYSTAQSSVKRFIIKLQLDMVQRLECGPVQLLKDGLGYGSYGAVYKAKYGDLVCAAKVLDPSLVANLGFGADRIIEGFRQQCELLSKFQHPNIVQFLGMYQDPDTKWLFYLTELMDCDLTRYLESSQRPLPYHLQVNICHDVASALYYLHYNNIAHCDVTGKAVLLLGDAVVAKLSNFDGAVVNISNEQDLATCPGTVAYMPPEVFKDNPTYDTKLDCFSYGVLVVQILSREFPCPSNVRAFIRQGVEIERRQNHINLIDPNHPLLPIALDCLQDEAHTRPSAHQIYERIAVLKETPQYTESKREYTGSDLKEQIEQERREQQDHNREEIHRLRSEVQKRDELVEDILQQKTAAEREIQSNLSRLQQQQRQSEEENHQVRQELSRALSAYHQQQQQISLKDRELEQANRQAYDFQQQLRDEQQHSQTSRQEMSARLREKDVQIDQLQQQSLTSRQEMSEKDAQIDQLQRRLHQAEADGLGSHLSQLQLQPQGKSWNVPRDEIRITEQIGYGAAGLVSKGIYQGQTVAVKQIHREILREKHIMDEFKREVGIMATIQHPNLVRFIAAVFNEEVDRLRDTPLLVLELLHTNLRRAYNDYNLGPTQAVSIFRDVAYALHYLHKHSEPIIHRDVSAPNVLLEALSGDSWRAKLSDFGSANFARHAKTLGVGAIVYTAPEMFPRDGPLSAMPRPTTKCDVFSYGIILVEVITKKMPTSDNRHRLFSDVKERWRLMYDLIAQCADANPDNRPTMADVLNKLNRIPTARPRPR